MRENKPWLTLAVPYRSMEGLELLVQMVKMVNGLVHYFGVVMFTTVARVSKK